MLIDATTTQPDYFGRQAALKMRYPNTRASATPMPLPKEENTGFLLRFTAIALTLGTFAYIGISTLSMGVAVVG